MKKLFSAFVFFCAAAPLFAAASTCETRVDKHPDATTTERVEYCLTEEPAALADSDVTEVVISDTYSVQFPKPKTKQPAPQQQVSKIYVKEPIAMEYLDRDDYPAFRNDILPSPSPDDAHAAALELLGMANEPEENTGTKSLKKPARVMKQPPQTPQEPPAFTDTASYAGAQTAYSPANQPTYPAYQVPPAYQSVPPYQATPAANTAQPQTSSDYTQQPAASGAYTQPAATQTPAPQDTAYTPSASTYDTSAGSNQTGLNTAVPDQNNFDYDTAPAASQF